MAKLHRDEKECVKAPVCLTLLGDLIKGFDALMDMMGDGVLTEVEQADKVYLCLPMQKSHKVVGRITTIAEELHAQLKRESPESLSVVEKESRLRKLAARLSHKPECLKNSDEIPCTCKPEEVAKVEALVKEEK